MQVKLKKLRSLGKWDKKYRVWRQTEEQEKRKDIDSNKLYLVSYHDVWLLGRFGMQWYGWNFHPNMGSMSMQIEWLKEIYEVTGLRQEKHGSTASHILEYLAAEASDETEEDERKSACLI